MIGGDRSRDLNTPPYWSGDCGWLRDRGRQGLLAGEEQLGPVVGRPGELWLVEAGHVTTVLISDWSGLHQDQEGLRPLWHRQAARDPALLRHQLENLIYTLFSYNSFNKISFMTCCLSS